MTTYQLQYPKSGVGRARALRRTMTDSGRKLWSRLRNNQLGVHFRREVPQGPYICDFLCVSANLVVEVDGGEHNTAKGRTHDAKRDSYLKEKGFHVLRFSNQEVLKNIDGVLQSIYEHIQITINSPHL